MVVTEAMKLEIARLYIATFNRVPDTDGFNYWLNEYSSGMGIDKIAQSFMLSTEAATKYPSSQSSSAFLDTIYLNVLGRAPDSSGKVYWTDKLAGGLEKSIFILAIVNGALALNGDDANYLNNRAEYGVFCVTNDVDSTTAASNLRTITSDSTTLDAVTKINLSGSLTVSTADSLIGGDGDDSFSGGATTAHTTDIVSGGAGTDTLLLDGTTTVPNISGVEIVIVRGAGGGVDVSSKTDVSMLTIDSPLGDGDYILGSQAIAIQNSSTPYTFNLKYGSSATSATIALNGVGKIDDKSVLNIASGTAIATLNITTTGADSFVKVQNSGYAPISTVNIYGDKAVDIDISDASMLSATTVSGQSNSGGISLKLANMSDVVYTVTTGLGSDTIDIGNRLTAADKIDGGAGSDTLEVVSSATASTDANLKGIENIVLMGQTTLTLTGQSENFVITGSGYDDTITAGLGADTINGGNGNDTIYTANGGSNDKIDGGGGDDTLVVAGGLVLVGDSNITNIENIRLASAVSIDISDQSDSFVIIGSSGADTIMLGSGSETIKFAQTAALNGSDTIYNFNFASDKIDITQFLGENSATVNTTPSAYLTGLDLTGGYNAGVIYNKSGATLLSTDIASAAAASKVALDDNGKALVFVTADSDGVADSVISSYSLYFVEDTDTTVGSSTFAATKVGVFTNSSELAAADLIAANFI